MMVENRWKTKFRASQNVMLFERFEVQKMIAG